MPLKPYSKTASDGNPSNPKSLKSCFRAASSDSSPSNQKSLKPFFRVAAFDDGSFKPKTKTLTPLVGVICRSDGRVEGILSAEIQVDGLDSTDAIIKMMKKSRFRNQASFILLQGINFAGFNIADISRLSLSLRKPVIAAFRKQPNMQKIRKALSAFPDSKERLSLIKRAGKIHTLGSLHFQFSGTGRKTAEEVIKRTLMHSLIPEPLRLAHMIASGITLGESTRP